MKCEVSLQNLLKHTVERLLAFLNLNFSDDDDTSLVLRLKYGFDGTNANVYKQKSENNVYTSSIFCSSLVPLELVDKATNMVFWRNPRPSSTRFCRPIKMMYEKETEELCRREEAELKTQISELQDIRWRGCTVGFEMSLTMIDGKV